MSCLKSSLAEIDDSIPSTGELEYADTTRTAKADTMVSVSISYIKLANAKLIERLHLYDIINEQDSIRKELDAYIKKQQDIIVSFQSKVNVANEINKQLQKDLVRQRKRTKLFGTIAGISVTGIIVGLIIR